MNIEFQPLRLGNTLELHKLVTDPRVAKHMPLADLTVSPDWVEEWKHAKSQQWPDENMGPWIVYAGGRLAGWAGVQPDTEDTVELGVVLNAWAWNLGLEIAKEALTRWLSFGDKRQVVIYLPDSRNISTLTRRLGLSLEKSVEFAGRTFHRLAIDKSILMP